LTKRTIRKLFFSFYLTQADESHRSISGNNRAVFEYFLGYKLGLMATPKDYIKNIDINKIRDNDPRAWERRQLLDTYKTFGCESGHPTFSYSLLDGVKEGYLINPIVVDARTDITTQLLAEKGYAIVEKLVDDVDDENQVETETYFARDFEKNFFSDETNRIFVKTFFEAAKRDPLSGEIGKSIIFCVSRKHACKITQILNEFADVIFPDKYQSDFAMQITSEIVNAQQFTINFQNNNLRGTTKFLENYKSSKTRVCVTVGMMTTGYDCEDLLNIGLLRPIFSPTDFVQIKGRGTRTFVFKYKQRVNGETFEYKEKKDKFKLFDFFGNVEYFENKYNYDEVIELPKSTGANPGLFPFSQPSDIYESIIPDPLKTIVETIVSEFGMKIDRKLYEKFEDKVKDDDFVREQYESGNVVAAEQYIINEIFDKPNEFFNMEKLRRAIGVDRRVSLREMLDKIFGAIPTFKSRAELISDEFDAYSNIYYQ
jgi:type I restriction enzyme R subunit